jgi:hypothetical protein
MDGLAALTQVPYHTSGILTFYFFEKVHDFCFGWVELDYILGPLVDELSQVLPRFGGCFLQHLSNIEDPYGIYIAKTPASRT